MRYKLIQDLDNRALVLPVTSSDTTELSFLDNLYSPLTQQQRENQEKKSALQDLGMYGRGTETNTQSSNKKRVWPPYLCPGFPVISKFSKSDYVTANYSTAPRSQRGKKSSGSPRSSLHRERRSTEQPRGAEWPFQLLDWLTWLHDGWNNVQTSGGHPNSRLGSWHRRSN